MLIPQTGLFLQMVSSFAPNKWVNSKADLSPWQVASQYFRSHTTPDSWMMGIQTRGYEEPQWEHSYRGSNALCDHHGPVINCVATNDPQMISFKSKDSRHEDLGCNNEHVLSLSTSTTEKLTEAKSTNASPQNQRGLPHLLSTKHKPGVVFTISTSKMSCFSG